MDLSDILAISGKSGLFTIIGQTKNNVIVESIIDGKRFPTFSSNKISALKDVSIYTNDGEIPLSDVYSKIYEKENGGSCISHKETPENMRSYLESIIPDYDKDQVFVSDIKKLFQWYNILHSAKKLKPIKVENSKKESEKTESNKKIESDQ